MIRLCASLALMFWAVCAAAQDFPARYFVHNVSADDVLNIRAEPSAGSDILGTLPPFAVNVEVLRTTQDGKWGRVSAGEQSGWVSMSFMSRAAETSPYDIPRPMTCLGTEPFWSLSLGIRGSEYQMMGEDRRTLTEVGEAVAAHAYLATFQEGPTLARTLMITRELCSDGMSDREFGFSARLFTEAPDGNRFLRGCCTLDHSR